MSGNGFVSGGRNPNCEDTCGFPLCRYLKPSNCGNGGWCLLPENRVPPQKGWPDGFTPSVSSNGWCNSHSVCVSKIEHIIEESND